VENHGWGIPLGSDFDKDGDVEAVSIHQTENKGPNSSCYTHPNSYLQVPTKLGVVEVLVDGGSEINLGDGKEIEVTCE